MKRSPPRCHETTTQLHDAVAAGRLERVKELLDVGVPVDALTIHHVTPLMTAAKRRQQEVAKLLIEKGANVNAKNRRSEVWEGRLTPLHYAVEAGCLEIVRLLVESGAHIDSISQTWQTPMFTAVWTGRRKIIDYLLAHGANPNGPVKCDQPPLVSAAWKNDCELISEFIRRGADPNRVGCDGSTAIGSTSSLECLRLLIQAGADVNQRNGHGETPLAAQLAQDLSLIQTLIDAGADVNARAGGYTLLMLVMMNIPRYDVARILLEAGADPNGAGEYGTALNIYDRMTEQTCNDAAVRSRIASLLERNGGRRAA